MRTDAFDYDLPPELIAQTPAPRGESRLMILNRETGEIAHRRFPDILDYLRPDDTLVLNDSRVSARRLFGARPGGGPTEVILLRPVGETDWEALAKPAKALRAGKTLTLFSEGDEITAQIVGETEYGGRILRFSDRAARDQLAHMGEVPLPPYIHAHLDDEERYQTVYAAADGSGAAPTAGLHFTEDLLNAARAKGVRIVRLTLHIGVGTFRPVRTENIEDHVMHAETVLLSEEAAGAINAAPGRIVAVGTTAVRALETAARVLPPDPRKRGNRSPAPDAGGTGLPQNWGPGGGNQTPPLAGAGGRAQVVPFCGETRLYLTPGSRFLVTDALLTNFHTPRSTLLMLVSAFAGSDFVRRAYAEAVRERYRFFSFGDAMFIF